MKKEKSVIPVFFTIDDGYAPYASVAIASLLENASKDDNYKIHIVHQGLSEENKRKLSALADAHSEIIFSEMADTLKTITDREENRLRCDYFTLTIYFRLFLADMFPEYEKGIYLDSDIVVPGDISELYQIELGEEFLIGACPDYSIQNISELVRYLEQGIGVGRMEYINSGVLVMNMKAMRESALSHRFLQLLNTYHVDCVAPDQDYLNAMCHGRIAYLKQCWDVMPEKDSPEFISPKLIHYNLFDKPWCYDGVQYEEYFWRYARKSAYYPEILAYKANYSEERKRQDEMSLAVLIGKADRIPDTDTTFRKLYESGIQVRL